MSGRTLVAFKDSKRGSCLEVGVDTGATGRELYGALLAKLEENGILFSRRGMVTVTREGELVSDGDGIVNMGGGCYFEYVVGEGVW